MSLYPVFLKLKNTRCLVIGGGKVAERKVNRLLAGEALVSVVAPTLTEQLKLLVKKDKIKHENREYKPGDLENYFLAIAATDSGTVNNMIYKEAKDKNILINSVDDPESSNFLVPAIVERGGLQIAISTSGKVPYFAGKLRQFLENKFYPELENEIDELYVLRKKIIKGNKKDKKMKFEELLKPGVDKILEKIDNKD